jgi:hypothetical protein
MPDRNGALVDLDGIDPRLARVRLTNNPSDRLAAYITTESHCTTGSLVIADPLLGG